MSFRSPRSSGEYPWLEWKIRLFFAAAMLSLAGIYFEEGSVTGVAIVVLALGLALRFAPTSDSDAEEEGDGNTWLE